MVQEQKTILEDKQEIIQQRQFQEQCFLMDFYEKFSRSNTELINGERVPKTYDNFVQILGNPSVIINKLLARGSNKFHQISPAEVALLQPKIRLFKTIFAANGETTDAELILDEFYDEKKIQEITMNKRQRGGGAGLKRFEWKDLGTNPGDSGKAFDAVLMLHFQSIQDFFKETPVASRKGDVVGAISYADLIRTPPNRFVKENVFNEKFFRLKVQVGWAVPPDTILISKELRESIQNNSITLFLNITNHSIEFNQNGTFDVSISYIGAIEARLLSAESDVLYIDRKEEEFHQNLIRQDEDRVKTLETKVAADGGNKGFFGSSGFFSDLERGVREFAGSFEVVRDLVGDPRISDDQLVLETLKKDVEQRLETKENVVRENKAKSYRRLLEKLEKKGRLFYVDVSKEELELLGENVGGSQFSQETSAALRAQRVLNEKRTSVQSKLRVKSYDQAFSGEELKKTIDNTMKEKDEEEREEILNAADEKFSRATSPKDSTSVRVNFIYFGDLVDTALEVLHEKEQTKFEKDDSNLFRFIMGPIEIKNSLTGQKDIISLADVPISLNLFQAWFLKKVIRPQKDKYLLQDFLRDACSELIVRALSPACFGDRSVKNLVSFSIFSLPTGKFDPLCPPATSQKFGKNRVHIDKINTLAMRKGQENLENMRHYFMIYVSGYYPNELEGDFEKDAQNGIYHFYVGADRGLLTKAIFKRADIQYLKESRIADEESVRKGDVFLSEPYNVQMRMIGNALFKPGMLFFIDPASIGMSREVPKSKRLPIGGYYSVIKVENSIAPGEFRTSLDGTWINSGLHEDRLTSGVLQSFGNVYPERSIDSK